MTPNGSPLQLPGDIPGMAQVTVSDIRIWEPAGLAFIKGGLERGRAVMRAEVLDIPRGMVALIPMELNFARKLHEDLGRIITELDGAGSDKQTEET